MAKESLGSMSLYQVDIRNFLRPGDVPRTLIVQARSGREAKAVAMDVYRENYPLPARHEYFRLRLDINSLCAPENNQPGWVYPVAGGKSYFYTFR